MEARVELVRSGDRIRTSCTQERTCVGAANALTNWAIYSQDIQDVQQWSSGTVPRGKPSNTADVTDCSPSYTTCCVRPLRNDRIHSSAATWLATGSRWSRIRIRWSTQSNAADILSILSSVCIAYSVTMVDCANTESSYSLLTVFPINTSYSTRYTLLCTFMILFIWVVLTNKPLIDWVVWPFARLSPSACPTSLAAERFLLNGPSCQRHRQHLKMLQAYLWQRIPMKLKDWRPLSTLGYNGRSGR